MPRRKKVKAKKKPIASDPQSYIKLNQHRHTLCIPYIRKMKPSKNLECRKCGDATNFKSNIMKYNSVNRPSGLTPKEKSYIICKCQAKMTRFKSLKNKGAQAIGENKVFTISGSCNPIRQALLERGWVEKLSETKMNLSRIRKGACHNSPEVRIELERLFLANLVDKHPPNFIWQSKDAFRSNITNIANNSQETMVNRLNADPLWTTKQGLCSSMKRSYWFYIEDVAEVNCPRSYITGEPAELEEFIKDYKITACTSLLKWVLLMIANEKPVFVDTGKISLDIVLFALCRCKEYLYRKENKDIDRVISKVSAAQWNCFLKKYYRIIGNHDVFKKDTENKLPLYKAYATFLLKQMHRFRPQLSCEGCHNIWIIKPAHNSRGRGIRLASKLTVITELLNKAIEKYVIQKYVEEPLLIHETKFDIRQYCLVTSTFPLVIWMYQDCYLKFSSQKFNLMNYHESIHLTNNAVQRNYKNCAGRHKELPPCNMWDSEQYKDYLIRNDKSEVWDKIIYPGMKKSIIGIMLASQDTLPVSKNRFELYGCDFMLDKEYKPWLIEINSSPDLKHTTSVTAKICPAVLSDLIKVVIDYAKDPTSSTGKFECIYRQPITMPKYGGDLSIRGISLPKEYFYKGNIDLRKTYDNYEDIITGSNIKHILDNIKQAFDPYTTMIKPENVSECEDHENECNNEITSSHSQNDYEVNAAASILMDELLDRIHSVYDFNLKSKLTRYKGFENRSAPAPVTPVPKTMSDDLEQSSNEYDSAGVIKDKESFNFIKLDDDRPVEKESMVSIVSRNKKIFQDIKNIFKEFKLTEETSRGNYTLSTESMLKATSKLINFINKIEKEYSLD